MISVPAFLTASTPPWQAVGRRLLTPFQPTGSLLDHSDPRFCQFWEAASASPVPAGDTKAINVAIKLWTGVLVPP